MPHPQIEADSVFVRDLSLCQLRLQNQSAVPWLLLLPRRAGVTEIHRLAAEDQGRLMQEITLASRALERLFAPDKINVAALGNIVPQLHVHIVGRYKNDPVWPAPVWGRLEASPYAPQVIADMVKSFNDDSWWR